jgi:hypothetical protein
MKVYFAATYSMRDQLKRYAEQLREFGIEVTSRWLDEPEPLNSQLWEAPEDRHIFYGNQDVEDVVSSDIMVSFNDPEKHFRQGRTVEFGMALAIARLVRPMRLVVVGLERENIFHYQKDVIHFDTWAHARNALIGLHATQKGFCPA